jgi:hypothetical protein
MKAKGRVLFEPGVEGEDRRAAKAIRLIQPI